VAQEAFTVFLIGGVAVYFWRRANPEDSPRFISAVKFRG
jgi:hypothetical protein